MFDGSKQRESIDGKPPFIITRNIKNRTSLQAIIREFQQVEKRRVHKRSNNIVEHVIISFSPQSTPFITDEILRDLGNKFLSLRGKDIIACGTQHLHHHRHLHICLGLRLNGLSSRISKREYELVKGRLQEYQMQKYPELNHSVVKHQLSQASTLEMGNQFPSFANSRTTQKETIAKALHEAYTTATSLDQFLTRLKDQSIEPYYRNEILTGVTYEGGRKYRLAKFGYDSKILEELYQTFSFNSEFEEIKKLRQQAKEQTIKQEKDQNLEAQQKRLESLGIKKGFREVSLTQRISSGDMHTGNSSEQMKFHEL